MLVENGLSTVESIVSTVVMWIVDSVGWVVGMVSAHRILIIVLTLSLVANMTLSSRSTRAYWVERRASKFLEMVQVEPDGIMARSITLRDLKELIAPPYSANMTVGEGLCRNKFRELAVRDEEYGLGGRIREGRERLGLHRHDLVVALRVVNTLEQELVRAEWARWVQAEARRCRTARKVMAIEGGIGRALDEYCHDCEVEEGQEAWEEQLGLDV